MRSARELLAALDQSSSIEDKLKWIADPATHRAAVAKFLESTPDAFKVTSMDSNVGVFTELPSGDEVKLLVAVTPGCPSGAMVRLRNATDHPRLDWPLYLQTHRLDYDHFIDAAGVPPRRFTVLCARSRASDLVGEDQETHIALSSQGSLSAHGESRLYVKKDSPAGRLLDARMVWGRVYVLNVELAHATMNAKPVLIVQDCDGAEAATD
jgi:hypothetical protein